MLSWFRVPPAWVSLSVLALSIPSTGSVAVSAPLAGEAVTLTGTVSGGEAGSVLAAVPDADGDGFADLLVGAPGSGDVYLVLNSDDPDLSRPLTERSTRISLGAPQQVISLAAADLDDDGRSELLLGLPGVGAGGTVAVFRGRESWPASASLSDADFLLTGPGSGEAGYAVTVVQDPDSTQMDVIVGAPGLDLGAGETFRVPADNVLGGGQQTLVLVDIAAQAWFSTASDTARLGEAVAPVGDLDEDGIVDLGIGAPGGTNGGEVYLVLSTNPTRNLLDLEQYASLENSLPGGRAGASIANAGDANCDGVDDIVLGAPGNGLDVAGQVFLFTGGQSFTANIKLFRASLILSSSDVGERLGTAVTSTPDVDGDGCNELLVSAPGARDGAGEVGFFLGRTDFSALDGLEDADLRFIGDGPGTGLGEDMSGRAISFLGAPGEPTAAPAGTIHGIDVYTLDKDSDGDGRSELEGDCDDESNATYPGAEEICDAKDNDCDGVLTVDELDVDDDGVPGCIGPTVPQADCDDNDAARYPGASEICDGRDNDCDGVVPSEEKDTDKDGYYGCSGSVGVDCDDTDPKVYPGAKELCDGKDNDCDGSLSPAEIDNDGDGSVTCTGSGPPDCDDTDPSRYPGATEACDGKDNDCDGAPSAAEQDSDGDGFTGCGLDGEPADCDDTEAAIYPGAAEVCDTADSNCDGSIPSEEADLDDDGFAPCSSPVPDCDDTDASRYPGALELCDGKDTNCDGLSDTDNDGDGYGSCEDPEHPGLEDCDDLNATTHPGANEICDSRDNDCDGEVPRNEVDADGDGAVPCGTGSSFDCNDQDASVSPYANEVCDGKDDNCDDILLPGEIDGDGDGHYTCGNVTNIDCNDGDPQIYTGATESCDGKDNDCNGSTPEDEVDKDGDGHRACEDCDDYVLNTYPGAIEQCDGEDNDCDGVVSTDETVDSDNDLYTVCEGDCNDKNRKVYPGAPEGKDGLDNDCDGEVDDVDCIDVDEDGSPAAECDGSTTIDCNDTDPAIYPGAPEGSYDPIHDYLVGDAKDNDCDGAVDEGTDLADDDGDGLTEVEGDCNDLNADIYRGHLEVLNDGIDNNCDGQTDEDVATVDNDQDGYANVDGAGNPLDCNDGDPAIHPNAAEVDGNDLDENCDGLVDADSDGALSDTDCDDHNPDINPGHDEVDGDGIDNNCDGVIDPTNDVLAVGPGLGCGALSQAEGVTVSCATTGRATGAPIRSGARPANRLLLDGAWIFLLALAPLAARRKSP